MKKYILLLVVFLFLSACSTIEEDTENYSGIIDVGKSLGYAYTVTKEQRSISWEIGYKENQSTIKEDAENETYLLNFRHAVNDSKAALIMAIIWGSYFIIVTSTTLFFYKKSKNFFQDGGIILILFVGIGIYVSFKASLDLNSSLQDVKYYYHILAQ